MTSSVAKTPGGSSGSDAAAEEDGSDTEEESEVDVEALEEDELWVQEKLCHTFYQ